ncbi:geranylgeranyl pyrophosphate synthase [Beauveria brongniartii RCEF 3172]|uniref:Geranylgeranyl pyrophosphate synthase n=1 Tax=Beauveria brongniartii RCEF 3172 TaxID=1081107 RepID=A0A166XBB6_9HYPO|nr:geranylgeranyl pyrophosphate synthase [Beauveria brongniartii RCEF 3172]
MDYKFSTLIDASVHDKEGLCPGIDLRIHEAADLEEVGAFRAQEDWRRLVGPLENPYGGLLGPTFNFITVAVPECLPDRLEIIAYALEVGFIHDDVIDNDIQDADLGEMGAALQDVGELKAKSASGKAKIAAQIIQEMMAIDHERAMTVAKSWASGVQHSSRRQEDTDFKTLEEYIPYRALDVGYMLWHGLVTFGCALTIPDDEADQVQQLLMPALATASLTNDLFSFEKERDDTNVQNGVLVVMKEHGCTEEAAREILKERIRAECAKYVGNVKDVSARADLSLDTKKYIEIIQYTLSGNLAWSTQCLRYHKNIKPNESQMLRATEGVEKHPATWVPKDTGDYLADNVQRNGLLSEELPMMNNIMRGSGDIVNGVGDADIVDGVNGVNGVSHGNANGLDGADHLNGIDCSKDSTEIPEVNILNDTNGRDNADRVDGFNYTNGGDGAAKVNGADIAQNWADSRKFVRDLSDPKNLMAMALDRNLTDLDDSVILQPYHYLRSLPSKGIRDQAIDALNKWLAVPAESTVRIKSIIQMLHGASLMLDDMQDASPLRRGKPSTHSIYGTAQTINSATYQYIQATTVASQLGNPACLGIFTDEMQQLHVGQSYDLHWTENTRCPSVPEYLKMVDKKTGGMFRMLTRLMLAESPIGAQIPDTDLSRFSCLIGRFFQIRDDYQNLTSADYAQQKGFAEDLDEGKYSFALIHCIQTLGSQTKFAQDAMHLHALLMKRRVEGKLSVEMKKEILAMMNKAKSLNCTLSLLRQLFDELEREVGILEGKFGRENLSLRVMLEMMRV